MITFSDANIFEVQKHILNFDEFSCENSPVYLTFWKKPCRLQSAIIDDILFLKYQYKNKVIFDLPFTQDIKKGICLLKEYCIQTKIPLFISCPEGERFENFNNCFKNEFNISENRDFSEYIYKRENLSLLKGKSFHSKRNHISKFKSAYNWSYESLSEANLDEFRKMTDEWYNSKETDLNLSTERQGLNYILDNYSLYDVKGGLLRVDGRVIAVTLGNKINSKVFDVNIEKAFTEFDGAYTVINNEFVKNELQDFAYINREDDMGLSGLRKAKLSYNPDIILKRYNCEIK